MGKFIDLKITEQELADHGMTSLSGTKWTNQAAMLKKKLDEDGTFVGERLGQVLDAMEDSTAAANVGAAPFGKYTAATVQGLVEETTADLQGKIDDVMAGVLPSDAVSTDKIRDGAVTASKIAAGVIPDKATKVDAIAGTDDVKYMTPAKMKSVTDHHLSAASWIKIASYDIAGSFEWTPPDLFDGKPYVIGALVIGGGASGGVYQSSSSASLSIGGASGYSTCFNLAVTPGTSLSLVVGQGGAALVDRTNTGSRGNAGGTSSFGGITVKGGNGGDSAAGAIGGQCVAYGGRPGFGGELFSVSTSATSTVAGDLHSCFNIFENKRILGSGGSSAGENRIGGKDPLTGLGGGDGVTVTGGDAKASSANAPGCGGGAATATSPGKATSGSGADGAVYIYARKGMS